MNNLISILHVHHIRLNVALYTSLYSYVEWVKYIIICSGKKPQ